MTLNFNVPHVGCIFLTHFRKKKVCYHENWFRSQGRQSVIISSTIRLQRSSLYMTRHKSCCRHEHYGNPSHVGEYIFGEFGILTIHSRIL